MTARIKRIIMVGVYVPLMYSKGLCQDTSSVSKKPEQQDLKDWLIEKRILKKKFPDKLGFLLVVPVVASNPTAGLLFGAGLTYAYKLKATDLRTSTISANATYSTKGLVNLNMKTNIFILNERMILNGDWRFLYNSEVTYGLGTKAGGPFHLNLNGYNFTDDSLGQNLKYHQVRLHETASWMVIKNLFAGVGIMYDYYYNITDDARDSSRSYQYQYSTHYGFNPDHYTAMGLALNVVYDSRDNQVNAYKGIYANANIRANVEQLGSTKNSSLLLTEYRQYFSFGRKPFPHVLSIWVYGNFSIDGTVPYLVLPAVGYDQRQKTGRGYTYGRFRGDNMMYGETELRFPISKQTGILGGVLFLNCTTTSNIRTNINLFDYLRPAYGGGLRIMVDKKTRTRLQLDAGVADKTVGIYFGVQETF